MNTNKDKNDETIANVAVESPIDLLIDGIIGVIIAAAKQSNITLK